MRVLASLLFFQTWLLLTAFAAPGEDLLVSKLPSQFTMAAKVPRAILVYAVIASVKENRGLAPQITAAAVRRGQDSPSIEAIVRAALRALAPTPTALEVLAVVQAAVANAPSEETAVAHKNGDPVATSNHTEGILIAAALEYPQFAEILNDAGNQTGANKNLGPSTSATPSQQQNDLENQVGPTKDREPGIGNTPLQQQGTGTISTPRSITFPSTVILPSGSGLEDPVTPIN
jgi:hypothetical protein